MGEKATDCKIKIPRRGDRSAGEEIVRVSIRYVGPRPRQQATPCETRCVRAAQLICGECLSLSDSLAQADVEREAQEELEANRVRIEQERIAVQRVLINWPDFEEADVRAALKESYDDEDAAIDLLLDGFHAEPESLHSVDLVTSSRSHRIDNQETKEEFPPLNILVRDRDFEPKSFTLCCSNRNAWLRKSKTQASDEDFPSLPVSRPRSRANLASTACVTTLRRDLRTAQGRRTRN